MKRKITLLVKICAIFSLLLCFLITGYGQAASKCFKLDKIKKLYSSTFVELNSTLFQENWEIVSNSNRAPFVFGNDTLMYDNFSQWKFELSIEKWFLSLYRKQGLQSILTLQTSKICYETIETELKNSKSVTIQNVEDPIQNLSIFHIQQGLDIVFAAHKTQPQYLIIVCDYAQVDLLIKAYIAEKESYAKILQEQKQAIQTALEQAELLRNQEHYAEAIVSLEQVMDQPYFERDELILLSAEVKNSMTILKKELNQQKYQHYWQLANKAFENEQYTLSKEYLLQAQQFDATSQTILQKIEEIDKIEAMLIVRKDSTFNYARYNKSICNEFQTTIFKQLRNYFLTIDAGDVDFSYTLSTDTLGKNTSVYQVDMFSLHPAAKSTLPTDNYESWSSILNTLVQKPIPAVQIDRLFVNTASTFKHHASWKTSFIKAKYGVKKIKFSPYSIAVSDKNKLKSYFAGEQSPPNGKYTIEKKEIKYQDSLYKTLTLKKLYSVGPEAMAYSMLFPGAGSLAATQGKKGWAALSTFIVFAGAGAAGWIVANKLEQKGTTYANFVRWASWGCLGVGGVIYISDIFVALKRGIDNAKKSRAIKATLKENAIPIQDFPQQIEF